MDKHEDPPDLEGLSLREPEERPTYPDDEDEQMRDVERANGLDNASTDQAVAGALTTTTSGSGPNRSEQGQVANGFIPRLPPGEQVSRALIVRQGDLEAGKDYNPHKYGLDQHYRPSSQYLQQSAVSQDAEMADTSRPRKRGRDEDDSYNDRSKARRDNNNDRRPNDRGGERRHYNNDRPRFNNQHGRGPNNRPPPRPAARLKGRYLHLADVPGVRDPRQEIEEVVKIVDSNYDDESVRKEFIQLTLELVTEQPLKIIYLAATMQSMNQKRPELVQEVLNKVAGFCQEGIDAGDWRTVKITLRFLACLQGLYSDNGVITVLEDLFQRTIDLQTASPEDVVGIEFVKIILLTIPYLLASSATGLEARIAALLEQTEIVASAPHPIETLVDPYPASDADQKPMACPSLLSILQKQLQSEANNGWQLTFLPRVQGSIVESSSGEETTQQQFSFPTIVIPMKVNPGDTLFPEVYFSMFADQDIDSVPPTSHIASTIIRDAIVDTMNLLDYNRMEVAKFLINLDCFYTPETFVKRATAYDKLKTIEEGKSTWKPEDMIIDAAFSQIFQLPESEHRFVYYHSVMFAATQQSPASIAPSLGRAIRFIYRNLKTMDMELGYRYMDWFSHHVSNFEFRWKWAEWVDDINESDLHSKKAFILGVIEKECRLSFPKRIASSIPQEWQSIISEEKIKEQPNFKFDEENEPYAKQGQRVHQLLRNRESTSEEMQAVLDEVDTTAVQQGIEPLIASTDVFMTTICHVGSKSVSHVLAIIDKNKDRLLAIGPASEAARRQIITAVFNYWRFQSGTAVYIIDKLLNYTIITPMSVIEWTLHDKLNRGRALAELHIYELVDKTMAKVTNRVRQIADACTSPSTPTEQRGAVEETLVRERQSMRDLFTAIEDAVKPVAEANNDEMIEAFDGQTEQTDLLQAWGEKWLRVWRRKAAIEEAETGEAAVVAKEEIFKIQAQVAAERAAKEKVAADEAAQKAAEEAAEKEQMNGGARGEEMEDVDDIR